MSLNHGKLLQPGEGMTSNSFGWKHTDKINRDTYYGPDEFEYDEYGKEYDTISANWLSYSFDYRLGFLDKYPFGKGMEIGFHLEEAFRIIRDTLWDYRYTSGTYDSSIESIQSFPMVEGPPMFSFSGRLGFPDIPVGEAIFHHNIELGWIVGWWVDNGWIFGYAAGMEYTWGIPYVNIYAILRPTDPMKSDIDAGEDNYFTHHDNHWLSRINAGVSIKIPPLPVVPDYIVPEIMVGFPKFTDLKEVGFTFQIGFRWLNGI